MSVPMSVSKSTFSMKISFFVMYFTKSIFNKAYYKNQAAAGWLPGR